MGRTPCCSKEEGLNRGAWTANEDKILMDYIKVHGQANWRRLPIAAGLRRCGKSCRLRWLNYLRPDIKRGNISPDEEDLIIRLHRLLGNRWSLIAGRIPGRTDNEIKNYWNTVLSKRALQGNELDLTCKDEMKFKKQRSMSRPSPSKARTIISGANVIHVKAQRSTKVFISPQKEAIRKDDDNNNNTAAQSNINAKLVHETVVELSKSSDGSFTLPTTSKEENYSASSKTFRMDSDVGEISTVSVGLPSDDLMQLCDFDFSDINTVICEYGNETNDSGEQLFTRAEGIVEQCWSDNDCVGLETKDSLDSDFEFLNAFLDSSEDLI